MSPAPQLIGRTIGGRFRVTGFIGEGAMAAVYRGLSDTEHRDVAIKIMHPQLLGDSTFVGRFRREAKAAAKLNHRNTVQIIDYGVDGRLPYIVMELVTGQDLFELLVVERRLSEARAARILIEICDVLAVAHDNGIVHRDLKPENVMVLREGEGDRVKVLDFGIAKIMEVGGGGDDAAPTSLSTSALTTVGMVVGTPAYMSPEQCRGDPVDGRSDIYACGILLYLLVTGRLPFQPTGAPWEVAMDHIRKPPPAPSMFLPTISPGLEATILTALSKFPNQRQQTARDLRDELTKLLPSLSKSVQTGATAGPSRADTMPVESIRSRAGAPSVRQVLEAPETLEPLPEPDATPPPPEDPEDRAPDARRHPRPEPPSYRADTETRAIPFVSLQQAAPEPAPPPDPDPDSSPPPEARRFNPEASTDPIPAEIAASLRPPISNPTSSEEVSSEIWEVGPNTLERMRPGSAAAAAAAAQASPPSPAAPPVATASPSIAPPTLSSRPQITVAPAAPPPPASPLTQLLVPAAVFVGLALGVLAFFLSR
jgi:serine/threonine-protein kinase